MNAKTTGFVCGLVLLVAAGALWLQFRPPPVKIDRTQTLNASTGVGHVLAEETANLIQGRGAVVVVAEHALELDRNGPDVRWNVFRDELKKSPNIQIAATELVKPEPEMGFLGCSASAFLQILSRHADAAAIVFLTDLPEWLTVSDGIPRHLTTKLLALDTMGKLSQRHYAGYFTSGSLAELIGANLAPIGVPAAQAKTAREWFDQHYQIYTPQNFDTLPE